MSASRVNNIIKKITAHNSKRLYSVLSILWIVLLVISIFAFSKPLSIEEQGIKNNIVQKTTFDYEVDLLPSLLHPGGGTVTPEGPIFTKITRAINLSINTQVLSDKPVTVEGTRRIICRLIAENLWEHDYFLRDTQEFNLSGTDNSLSGGLISIPIEQILGFFDRVQEEISAYPDGYTIKIILQLTGVIRDGDQEIPIDSSPELTFRLSNQTLELVGEREFVSETPIYENRIIHSTFNIMGKAIAIKNIRIIPISILLLLTIYLALGYGYRFYEQRSIQSELERILKRYSKRLTYLKSNPDAAERMVLDLKSFDDIIRISEDRDLPILSFHEKEDSAIFYVIDNSIIYSYSPEEIAADREISSVIGSDLSYAR